MNITGYSVEKIKDPTGILSGDRYEFFLDIEVDEEDELFSENGNKLRVLFYKNEEDARMLNYHFLENNTAKVLEFALDEEEEKIVTHFCNDHLSDTE